MKTKKLKNLVKKAKDELTWGVLEEDLPSVPLHIFSDSRIRVHTIFLPLGTPDECSDQDLHYLHELGHALLCERVHPFFSNCFPISGLDEKLLPAVSPVLNAAGDWFVGHWMMEFCRDAAIAELKKEYEATAEMMAKGDPPDVDKFFVAVLIIAQAIKYLDMRVECTGFLDAAVQSFLAVTPEKPTVQKIEELINRLLSLGAPYRCRRVIGQGQDVMEFYRASDT